MKKEMLIESLEEERAENIRLQAEVDRARLALRTISDGLSILACVAWDAKITEFEFLFKDYAPFKNLKVKK